jgi:hypothetical protein
VLKPSDWSDCDGADHVVQHAHYIYYDYKGFKVHQQLLGDVAHGFRHCMVLQTPTSILEVMGNIRSHEYVTSPACLAMALGVSDSGLFDGNHCVVYNPEGVRVGDIEAVDAKIREQMAETGGTGHVNMVVGVCWPARLTY